MRKNYFITGGAGFLGKAIIDLLLRTTSDLVTVFSRDESKHLTLKNTFNQSGRVKCVLGDIRDYNALSDAIAGHNFIVHVAALKQVPYCEENVLEAIKTNILGTENIIRASLNAGVEKVVAISTDKAVEPVNAMGQTKALMEKLLISANTRMESSNTRFACIRFGNIFGSTGSLAQIFTQHYQNRKCIPVTDPRMTRFFISKTKAVEYLFRSMQESIGGEIFVYKCPCVKVIDLAEFFMRCNGGDLSKIITTGIRAGEKLHESLLSSIDTKAIAIRADDFVIVPPDHIQVYSSQYPGVTQASELRHDSNNPNIPSLSGEDIQRMNSECGGIWERY